MSGKPKPKPKPVALLVADLHLSLRPPLARAREKDWFEAMARPLKELRDLAATLDVPILCAGDVFDRWNAPPELINWAIANVPKMKAIPGQHDLPLHNLADLKKSAFWTLMEAGVLEYARGSVGVHYLDKEGVAVFGVPFGESLPKPNKDGLNIALLHEYHWSNDTNAFKGASTDGYVPNGRTGLFQGYDVVVIGDNHKPWELSVPGRTIYNCGTFMRRHSDDKDYPSVGVLYDDCSVKRHYLDTSEEQFDSSVQDESEAAQDFSTFVRELGGLAGVTLDYMDSLYRAAANTPGGVQKVIAEAMEVARAKKD